MSFENKYCPKCGALVAGATWSTIHTCQVPDWKVTMRCKGIREPFVDWYQGTEQEARDAHREDCHRYGIPDGSIESVTFERWVCEVKA